MAFNGNGMNNGQFYPQPLATHEAVIDNKNLFLSTLSTFLMAMNTKFYSPEIDGCWLNLHWLYVQVTNRGGFERVVATKRWKEVSRVFKFSAAATNVSYVLKKHYSRLLYHYEQVYFFGLVMQPFNYNNLAGHEDNLIVALEPLIEDEIVALEPLIEDEIVASELLIEDEIVASEPLIEDEIVASEPLIEDEIVASEPLIEDEIVASEPLIEDEIVFSLAPPSVTVTYAPPSYDAGSSSAATQSIVATLETPTNASIFFVSPPSDLQTYVPPAIVARNFTRNRIHSIIIPSEPHTMAISHSLTPPSDTMIYTPPTTEDRNTTTPELPINASSNILAPVPDTMMYAPPTPVARGCAKFRFSSTNIAPNPVTRPITLSFAPASNTMMGAPPTTQANNLPLVPLSNTMMSPAPTNAGSSNVAATQSNNAEKQIETPEPKRRRTSGYICYLTRKQVELRASHPNTTTGKITKMARQAWTKLAKEEKMVYRQMAMEARARN